MTKLFDPRPGDARPGAVTYYYSDDLAIAISAALAADRPLLLRGNPGAGKTTLAKDVAWCLDRRYQADVITSRTQAQDLQWRFDAVRRLADLQADPKRQRDDRPYIEPGVLWRAYDPADAAGFGAGGAAVDTRDAVVLLDEIDKADPDVPNDLLGVIEDRSFRVAETGHVVRKPDTRKIFLVLTTNRERELPGAFMRRCVVFDLEDPGADVMKTIARRHHGEGVAAVEALLDPLWAALSALRTRAEAGRLRAPTTAEFLDALKACLGLGIAGEKDPRWKRVTEATMWKHAPDKKA